MKMTDKESEIFFETAEHIQELANEEYSIEFPINLHLESMVRINLPELRWENFDVEPTKIKLSNTGKTVIISTQWADKRPTLSGGPLLGEYVFSQLHFHWGRKDVRGSKHTYNSKSYPLEMHALFYNTIYDSQEEALDHNDGAIVLTYAFRLDLTPYPGLEIICEPLQYVSVPGTSIYMAPFEIIDHFFHIFTKDYFLYWGAIRTTSCKHVMLWFICRQPFNVSQTQLNKFRLLFNKSHLSKFDNNNTSRIHPDLCRVFHVNPSNYVQNVLYGDEKIPMNFLKNNLSILSRGKTKDRMPEKRPCNNAYNVSGGNSKHQLKTNQSLTVSTSTVNHSGRAGDDSNSADRNLRFTHALHKNKSDISHLKNSKHYENDACLKKIANRKQVSNEGNKVKANSTVINKIAQTDEKLNSKCEQGKGDTAKDDTIKVMEEDLDNVCVEVISINNNFKTMETEDYNSEEDNIELNESGYDNNLQKKNDTPDENIMIDLNIQDNDKLKINENTATENPICSDNTERIKHYEGAIKTNSTIHCNESCSKMRAGNNEWIEIEMAIERDCTTSDCNRKTQQPQKPESTSQQEEIGKEITSDLSDKQYGNNKKSNINNTTGPIKIVKSKTSFRELNISQLPKSKLVGCKDSLEILRERNRQNKNKNILFKEQYEEKADQLNVVRENENIFNLKSGAVPKRSSPSPSRSLFSCTQVSTSVQDKEITFGSKRSAMHKRLKLNSAPPRCSSAGTSTTRSRTSLTTKPSVLVTCETKVVSMSNRQTKVMIKNSQIDKQKCNKPKVKDEQVQDRQLRSSAPVKK